MCSRLLSVATSTRSILPSPGPSASSSASISSSAASLSFRPSRSKTLIPLYSGGLCEAETTTPRSSASSATAGVGSTPASTALPPASTTPRANASSSSGPDPRVSRPTKTRPPFDQSVAALPSRSTSSVVRSSPTIPRTPSVPKYSRTATLAFAELRCFAGLVEASLLALDDPGVPLEEAGALERLAQVRIGLDERAGDPVAHRPGLAARAAAVDAHSHVERALDACDLQRGHRQLAVREAGKVVLDRPPVEPGAAVTGAQDHPRNGGLALTGSLVLGRLDGSRHLRVLSCTEGFRVLSLMRMIRAGVDLRLVQLLPREAVPREHALDRLADHFGRPALELVTQRPAPQATRIAGMAVVELVVQLVAGDGDLLRVDDDDEVAGVDVRCVLRLRLAAQRVCDLGRQATKGLALGVNDVPAALDLARLCVPGLLHGNGGLDVRRPRIVATRYETPRLRRGWDGGRTPLRSQLRRRGRPRADGGRVPAARGSGCLPRSRRGLGAGSRFRSRGGSGRRSSRACHPRAPVPRAWRGRSSPSPRRGLLRSPDART